MSRARWTRKAQQDLAAIDEYYADLSPACADRVGDAAIAAGGFLARNPFAGPQIEGMNARTWRVGQAPYLLVYRPDADGVSILRIVHGSTDWQGMPI
ncbi:type II toxin-antitoxin system RelE/ParE family toxin [Sphingomonas sanxanigenens]|uniref:Plasmid stabilization protein n=1 Tax=Sphingomonas sanxanigenens DSM 19645 = NX02 TaxID=1123269 RepID=W0AJ97_9SPHN|nr:type II toxin-antitoxin system RelE/ParE family toxin [Sphingomonas sanxanigenens]AHE56622.1 hypothetical protein NX02_25075 [Sphingomonas sanxanigenens DSM 19645 = NX02]